MTKATGITGTTAVVLCLAAVLLAAATATMSATGDAKASARPAVARWQHLALTHDLKAGPAGNPSRKIVELGRDGWELVSVANHTSAGTTTKTVYYFKKPL